MIYTCSRFLSSDTLEKVLALASSSLGSPHRHVDSEGWVLASAFPRRVFRDPSVGLGDLRLGTAVLLHIERAVDEDEDESDDDEDIESL